MLGSYFIIGPDGDILLSKGNQRSTIPFESLQHMELTDLVDADKYTGREAVYDWN
jgi:radical S-adenosyl methionine domain-containing protein 2